MALRQELDVLNPNRGSNIGSFHAPRFDGSGNRLSTKVTGIPAKLVVNRRVRSYWKETSSPTLPILVVPPLPAPEKRETNRVGVITKKGVKSQRGRKHVGKTGIPCESLRIICCSNKAIVYGPKRRRLCFGCVKVAWKFMGYCPIKVQFVEGVL